MTGDSNGSKLAGRRLSQHGGAGVRPSAPVYRRCSRDSAWLRGITVCKDDGIPSQTSPAWSVCSSPASRLQNSQSHKWSRKGEGSSELAAGWLVGQIIPPSSESCPPQKDSPFPENSQPLDRPRRWQESSLQRYGNEADRCFWARAGARVQEGPKHGFAMEWSWLP